MRASVFSIWQRPARDGTPRTVPARFVGRYRGERPAGTAYEFLVHRGQVVFRGQKITDADIAHAREFYPHHFRQQK